MSHKLAIAAVLASSLPFVSSPVFAADDATATDDTIEEIVVTGTYISRAREEMSTPVDVFDRSEFESQGSPNMVDLIANMPAISGSDNRSDQYTGASKLTGQQTVNMRGLGRGRTLALINGKRAMPSATSTAGSSPVDLGSYPSIAMSRIELLKNGGSTTYGSDAIAGVFNYITREHFEGFEVEASHRDMDGNSGDNKIGVIYGFAGDKFNIVASIEWEDRAGLMINDANLSVDPNPADGSWFLGSSDVAHPGSFLPYNPVTDTANQAIPALTDPACGTTYGESTSFRKSNGKCAFYYTNFTNVTDPAEHLNIFVQGRYDLNDSKELYGSFLYSDLEAIWATSPAYLPSAEGINYSGVSPAVVHPDNPGLVDFEATVGYGLLAPYFANAGTDGVVYVGRIRGAEGPGLDVIKDFEKFNLTVGSRGDLTSNIYYDVTFSYATNEADEPNGIEVLNANFRNALAGLGGDNCSGLDADRGNASAGCLWYNPFGSAIGAAAGSTLANSDEVMDYMMGTYLNRVEATQMVTDVVLTGDLPFAELPGGEIAWAAGGQIIDVDRDHYPYGDNNAALYPEGYIAFGALGTGYKGSSSQNTKSLFAEAQFPVLDNLDVDVGVRYTDFDGDSVTTPRISARWDITDWVSVRASYEEGFRRPILPSRTGYGITQVPGSTSYITIETPVPTDMDPEESENLSVGIMFHPIDGLNISIDYWDILLTKPFAVESNFGGDSELVFDPVTGSLVKVIVELFNGGDVELDGYDFQVDYKWDTSFASLQVGANGTYLSNYDIHDKDTGAKVYEAAGFFNLYGGSPFGVPSLPQLRSNAFVSVMTDHHFFRLYARYIEDLEVKSGSVDYFGGLGGIGNSDVVDSFLSYDAHYTYTLPGDNTRVSVSVLNLTDEEAPAAMHFLGYDARTHSSLGRVLKLSVRHAF